jgi:hypothetical protein
MASLHEILLAFLLPACVSGTILLAAARLTRSRELGRRRNAIAGAWALGLGYLSAHVELVGFPAWPSAQRTPSALDWLGWSIVFWLPCTGLYLTRLSELYVSRGLRALFSTALIAVCLRRWMDDPGSPWWVGIFIGLLLSVWGSTEALVRRSPGPVPVLALLVALSCASVASLLGHTAVVAQLAGALCCTLGASAVVARLAPAFQLSAGAVAVVMLVFAGVLLNGVLFSDVHWSSALFSILALVAPWLATLFSKPARGPWTTAAIRASIALPFGVAAIVAAYLGAPSYEY